jgi:hypothetical protein
MTWCWVPNDGAVFYQTLRRDDGKPLGVIVRYYEDVPTYPSLRVSRPAKRLQMDKDTKVSLHRSKMGRVDKMIRNGRFEDLYRELKAVAPSTRSEYFMMEAGRKVGPQEIEDLAKQLGIIGRR